MTPSNQATPRLELYSALIMGLRDTTYPSLSSSPSASTPNHLMTCSGGTIYGVDEGVTEGGVWFKWMQTPETYDWNPLLMSHHLMPRARKASESRLEIMLHSETQTVGKNNTNKNFLKVYFSCVVQSITWCYIVHSTTCETMMSCVCVCLSDHLLRGKSYKAIRTGEDWQ